MLTTEDRPDVVVVGFAQHSSDLDQDYRDWLELSSRGLVAITEENRFLDQAARVEAVAGRVHRARRPRH